MVVSLPFREVLLSVIFQSYSELKFNVRAINVTTDIVSVENSSKCTIKSCTHDLEHENPENCEKHFEKITASGIRTNNSKLLLNQIRAP